MRLNYLPEIVYKIRRKIWRFMGCRPSNQPYLSGDNFRKLANHVYDQQKTFQPQKVKQGEIVFVQSDYLENYFNHLHPFIKYPYKLITHNSDRHIGPKESALIDEKIIHWFAQNISTKHPRLTPIPIGLDNLYWSDLGQPELFNKHQKINENKKNRIIFNFSIQTNPISRQPAYDFLKTSPISDELSWINNQSKYLEKISSYKFIADPDGHGLDNTRRWQALYLDIVPIVTKSETVDYFRNLGLPFYVIKNWQELEKLNESDLEKIYNQLMTKRNKEAQFFNYWQEKIIKTN